MKIQTSIYNTHIDYGISFNGVCVFDFPFRQLFEMRFLSYLLRLKRMWWAMKTIKVLDLSIIRMFFNIEKPCDSLIKQKDNDRELLVDMQFVRRLAVMSIRKGFVLKDVWGRRVYWKQKCFVQIAIENHAGIFFVH